MNQPNAIVLDIETARGILKNGEAPEINYASGQPYEYASGFDDHTNPPAITCIWDCTGQNKPQSLYLEKDLPELNDLIRMRDYVVTFNGDGFDLPILRHAGLDIPERKSIDLAKILFDKTGKRSKLETVALKNLSGGNFKKPMAGAEAPKIWQRFQASPLAHLAEFCELVEYCHHDVWLTWRLYMNARKHGGLRNSYGDFIQMEIA